MHDVGQSFNSGDIYARIEAQKDSKAGTLYSRSPQSYFVLPKMLGSVTKPRMRHNKVPLRSKRVLLVTKRFQYFRACVKDLRS